MTSKRASNLVLYWISLLINLPSSDAIAENEFRAEVTQSLERAFAEGHSIDNAAVELKTLRMASNVPLSRVREAVVAAIVERVRIVESGGAAQRAEIINVIQRWGGLIDRIGGVDAGRNHFRSPGKIVSRLAHDRPLDKMV